MNIAQERIFTQISTYELERRWKAVRAAMKEQGIDVLIMQNADEFFGGYVKWFTDIPARNGVPNTVIFPREDEMTVIYPGPRGGGPTDLTRQDWALRGVKKRLTAPYHPSLLYTWTYASELVVQELKTMKYGNVGLIGSGTTPVSFADFLKKNLTGAKFEDATDLVDHIKAIKTDEEIELIKKTAAIQDIAMEKALEAVKPGKRDLEIAALVQQTIQVLGSEEQLIMAGSAPMGTPAPMLKRHFMNRKMKEGDQFTLMIETNGPGGLYTELGRTIVLGNASDELLEQFEIVKEAQLFTVNLLKPDADPKDLINAHNEFMRSRGCPEERRMYAHGQGYDLVERPAIREEESMKLKANMNIAVHPMSGTKTVFAWICDNYLVTESGAGDCLHKTPKKIFEV